MRTFGQVSPPRNTTPLKVCGGSGSTLQGVFRYPPPSTSCGCSEVITPPGLSHPHIYHTPKRTLWAVGRAITSPGLSHPLGAAATSTLSPGLHKIPHTPPDTTPGDNIFKRSKVSPGVCYLVQFTVGASRSSFIPWRWVSAMDNHYHNDATVGTAP